MKKNNTFRPFSRLFIYIYVGKNRHLINVRYSTLVLDPLPPYVRYVRQGNVRKLCVVPNSVEFHNNIIEYIACRLLRHFDSIL